MIEFRNLYKSFRGEAVLRGVDLVVHEGETLALLGGSGTGKSVMIKHAIGLLEPDEGDVIVDGISIRSATPAELQRVRRNVGYVFQNAALFDSLTVLENMWLALCDDRCLRTVASCRAEAADLLRKVNLDPTVLDLLPAALSGGMRKRVGVARAIASSPRYLLYDEPTTGLDPINAEYIDALIAELDDKLGVTSIVVTHDMETAFQADRIALLHDGRIRICAPPEEFAASTDPVVQRFVRRSRAGSPVLA